ncbi:hypothetical protein BZA77DRAFT_355877 [Pyronema omphalodes]|nr:hypothetical protein BZA77DRAFT_355877 [Pyronema omphalodes]
MDVYTKPEVSTYLTSQFFHMPSATRSIWAITFSNANAQFITNAYTLLITFIFLAGWGIIVCLVAYFYKTEDDPNRYIGLVAFLNSNEPWAAVSMMLSYCKRNLDKEKDHKQQGLLGGVILLLLSIGMVIGNIVTGILVPANMSIGNAAPASPSILFYPDVAGISARRYPPELLKLRALRGPPAFRAIGSIEASKVTLREKVSIPHAVTTGSGETSGMTFPYSYTLSGSDFGLQRAPKLFHVVNGSCETDYTWYQKDKSTGTTDVYYPWGISSISVNVSVDNFAPIKVDFVSHPQNSFSNPNDEFRYAVVVHAAGRRSYGAGRDPFFRTKNRKVNESNSFAPYEVERQRPILSCKQTTHWDYNGKQVGSHNLKDLPGVYGIIGRYLIESVFPNELGIPRVFSLALTIGQRSIFLSSSQSTEDGLFDADIARIWDDMERLILAAYASSRNILLDMTMVSEKHSLANDAEGPDKQISPDTADFVVVTGDVTTLSGTILIAVPCILIFLSCLLGILNAILRFSSVGLTGKNVDSIPAADNYVSRLRFLQATQLYRFLNERDNYFTLGTPKPPIVWKPKIEEKHGLHLPFTETVEKRVALLPICSQPFEKGRPYKNSPASPAAQGDTNGSGGGTPKTPTAGAQEDTEKNGS